MESIRIGAGAGFWGDALDAPRRLAEGTDLDVLVLEYLAELTMSILAHQRRRDPEAGFVGDLVPVVESLLPRMHERPEMRLVTNGGGMNPAAAARAVSRSLVEAGLSERRVAAVAGDDVLDRLEALRAGGEEFANLDDGRTLDALDGAVTSANVYLGASGIVEALGDGADIVLTGRVADASLVVGPAIHAFGWDWSDWDRLAAATVAGHLVECGAQVTGGMFSAWEPSISLGDIGYPFVDLDANGSCVIGKPDGTGGRVDIATVAEQLVYEIGDPAHYLTPDVDVDLSGVRLDETASDRVTVTSARGTDRPERLKVSMSYADGWRAAGTLVVAGRDAETKARAAGAAVLERLRSAGVELERTHVEVLGTGDSCPGVLARPDPPLREVVLRIAVADHSREHVDRFCRELAPLVTSGPPGVTGYTGGRPRPQPVLAHWPTTIAREHVVATVEVRTAGEWLP